MKSIVLQTASLCVLLLLFPVAGRGQQQETPIAEAGRLTREVRKLFNEGRFDEAIPLANRTVELVEKTLGPDDPLLASSLSALAALYRAKDNYVQAEPLYKRALSIREKKFGPDHPDVAVTVNSLAGLYYKQGNYATAEPLYKRVLSIRQKALGIEHPDLALPLDNLADLYVSIADYAQAEALYKRALAIREKALGPEHADLALSFNNLGQLFQTKTDYIQAQSLLERALAIREKAFPPEHPLVGVSLNNLALLHEAKGDYLRAESLLRRTLALDEKAFGPADPITATTLNNLAELHRTKGEFAEAEALHKRALAIREKAFGTRHLDLAASLNNFGLLYLEKGDYEQAERFLLQALEIHQQILGLDHPHVATSLNNVGLLYSDKGDYTKAEPILKRALAIQEKVFGLDHEEVAKSLNNLALVYTDKGDYAQALPLFDRALKIDVKSLGPEHPTVATVTENFAGLNEAIGNYQQAESLYKRALDIRQRSLGSLHPDVSSSLNHLSRLYIARRDSLRSMETLKQANSIDEYNLTLILGSGSERQKQLYLNTLSTSSHATVSLHVQSMPKNPDAARLALTAILQRKGRALDAMSDQIGALRGRASPSDQALLDDLATARSQIAVLQFSGKPQLSAQERETEIARLTREAERLEGEIGVRSTAFRKQSTISLDAVSEVIPDDAALVEFFLYRVFNSRARKKTDRLGEAHYVAYVLHHKQAAPDWVDLGRAVLIDKELQQFRAALRDPKRSDVRSLAGMVEKRVMSPVRKLIGAKRRILLSPDGVLNLIPFAAMIDEKGKYLIENYSITYLSSGRDLLRVVDNSKGSSDPVVIADPLYDLTWASAPVMSQGPSTRPPADRDANRRSNDFTLKAYSRLPGTAQEAEDLIKLLPQGTQLLIEEQATEAAVKQIRRPSILHIATHGFFLPNQTEPSPVSPFVRGTSDTIGTSSSVMRNENPLLRSGLILAGVKQRSSGSNEDGVLTALEMTGLDLWGTKLVVLSACDTGLGDVRSGDGVYGLRRALVLAGSQTQMISLWKVSDTGTRDLMTSYYMLMQRGVDQAEALRRVQLDMLRGQLTQKTNRNLKSVTGMKYSHPFYWASFIQSGMVN